MSSSDVTPSIKFDPVEKVVEVLFFAFMMQKNPGKCFLYLPLDGNAESLFGDGMVVVKEMFVFEFKRNLKNVKGELEKFARDSGQPTKSGSAKKTKITFLAKEFAEIVKASWGENLPFGEAVPFEQRSEQDQYRVGHTLIALRGTEESGTRISFESPFSDAGVDVCSYLPRLMEEDQKTSTLSEQDKGNLLRFEEGYGFEPKQGKSYFEWVKSLKNLDSGGGGSADSATYGCYVVYEDGSFGVACVTGLPNLIQLYVDAADHNEAKKASKNNAGSSPTGNKLKR